MRLRILLRCWSRAVIVVPVLESRIGSIFIQMLIQVFVRVAQSIQPHRPLPAVRFYGHTNRIEVIALGVQLLDELIPVGAVLQTILYVRFQLLPMGGLAVPLALPVGLSALAAEEGGIGQDRQPVLLADGVRDLPQVMVLLYAVPVLVPVPEGDGVHYKMIV